MFARHRTLLRYTGFQIPDLILLALGLAAAVRWWDIPVPVAYTIFALWIVKDIAMYPMMRVAYASGDSKSDRLTGAAGIAKEALDPTGYVKVASELWIARVTGDSAPVAAGSPVRVIGLKGLTLLVEPVSDEPV